MSDDKQAKEVKDEELDKVSGGANADAQHIKEEDRLGHHQADSSGKHNIFSTGGKQVK
jgi:hypothetical protein